MENTAAIARIEHLAKIYAAEYPSDLLNALTRVADLARVGAEVIEGQVSWRGQMLKGYLDLASELVGRGVGFGYYGGENPATTAAVAEIDRLRAEVERLENPPIVGSKFWRDEVARAAVTYADAALKVENIARLGGPSERERDAAVIRDRTFASLVMAACNYEAETVAEDVAAEVKS